MLKLHISHSLPSTKAGSYFFLIVKLLYTSAGLLGRWRSLLYIQRACSPTEEMLSVCVLEHAHSISMLMHNKLSQSVQKIFRSVRKCRLRDPSGTAPSWDGRSPGEAAITPIWSTQQQQQHWGSFTPAAARIPRRNVYKLQMRRRVFAPVAERREARIRVQPPELAQRWKRHSKNEYFKLRTSATYLKKSLYVYLEFRHNLYSLLESAKTPPEYIFLDRVRIALIAIADVHHMLLETLAESD